MLYVISSVLSALKYIRNVVTSISKISVWLETRIVLI